MIAVLHGVVADVGSDRVVVMASGVGYEVLVPASTLQTLPAVGGEARLLTRLVVRDDAMILFGFASAQERTLFDHLVSVNGVGPKLALGILSTMTPDAVHSAVASEDAAALTTVPGVGKKVAGRIVLDLKDVLGIAGADAPNGPLGEVREALLALGLTPEEARAATTGLEPSDDVEVLLRAALQSVGRA